MAESGLGREKIDGSLGMTVRPLRWTHFHSLCPAQVFSEKWLKPMYLGLLYRQGSRGNPLWNGNER
jgi:hypothetical protein